MNSWGRSPGLESPTDIAAMITQRVRLMRWKVPHTTGCSESRVVR